MTTVTDSKIQAIQELVINLKQDLKTEVIEITTHLSDLDQKNRETDSKLIELSCNLDITSSKLEGNNAKIETNKDKIKALDKRIVENFFTVKIRRLTNKEFMLRTVISAIIMTVSIIATTILINYIWTLPLI